jgi:LmbE family N-acetylglucosaminyl deacetylase
VRDVLILAAHQDDCVVMAGEYAIAAVEAGRSVRIVYLTNGDSRETSPASERALRRNAEAIASWGSIGVSRESIAFLGLPAAPIAGPSRMTGEQLLAAKAQLVEIISALPQASAVFVPAAGESHVDHRTLRRLALEALKSVGRADLHIFEAPEYNPYVSLTRMPKKAFVHVIAAIPVVRRWAAAMRRKTAAPEEFPYGPRAMIMRPDQNRLERKRRMLEMFESEGGPQLVRAFGGSWRFRRIDDLDAAMNDQPRGYLPVGAYRIGML